jgi:integrase/recombinase XerD
MASGIELDDGTTLHSNRLASHRQVFLERLSAQGYAPDTIACYERTVRRFCEEMEQRGLGIGNLDGPVMEVLREAVLSGTTQSARTYSKFCLRQFIDHLVGSGVVTLSEPPAKEPSALGRLGEEYAAYLRQQRALSEATINSCMYMLKRFMAFRFGETLGDLNAITPEDIVTFLCQFKVGSRPYRDKSPPSRLRNLLKFLFWSGKTKRNLANSIPRVAQPKPTDLPRYLKPEEVQRLIEAARTNNAIGRRNYAMVLLLARLGLRAQEVIAIQIDDIDWRSGEILVRGKGKLHDRMPLVADVGEAIVDYIRNGRAGTSRALFVSSFTPHRPFKDAQILKAVLREAFEKTGLEPPQKYVGSHVLRHSLATDMLRKGASLEEIGDVLRHRSRMTTTIYAKHDIDALRSVARAWPVQGGAR